MNTIWFKRAGFIYIPVNFMGIAITVIAIAFLIPVYAAILRNEPTTGNDGFYCMFVYTTCTAFWWKWIADKTS